MPNDALRPDFSSRLSFWLLSGFLVVLWIAGGASRADVLGQSVVRFYAWGSLIAFTLFSARLEWRRVQPVAVLLGLAIFLVALQLVPLPPAIWTALPGRQFLTGAAEVSGQPQPWRPLSISPGATANALGSLVVPAAVLVLSAQLTRDQHLRILVILLLMVFSGSLLALLQFSGAHVDNALINDINGFVSGNFANRNHFALFVALGCVIAPAWGLWKDGQKLWKAILALTLLPFFLLVVLATGSRAGLLLAVLAIAAGLFLVRTNAIRRLRTLPRWAAATFIMSGLLVLVGAVILSFALGRATALDRALNLKAGEDLRSQAFPYVVDILGRYFPAGSGFGTFDPAFRISEPDALLQSLYLNRAHNDWLEVVLDGGLAGGALAALVLCWVLMASIRSWRRSGPGAGLARIGSILLLLTMLASIPDYPARTPLIMAVAMLAAVWLHLGSCSSLAFSAFDRTRGERP